MILPQGANIPGLDDSKKLSPEKRESLTVQLAAVARVVGIGLVEAEEIDRLNILQASLKAMRLALEQLALDPQQVLIDGLRKPGSCFPETAIVDGDARCLSIAAASVVAKVYLDRLMGEYDTTYPQYGFAAHKGYGTAAHLAALQEHGPCPLHRRSFQPVAAWAGDCPSASFQTFKEGLASCHTFDELERLGQFIKEGAGELRTDELQCLRDLFRRQRQRLAAVGRQGEVLAAEFLQDQGYRILERGYRVSGGEIDLIVGCGEERIFVEVKTSQGQGLEQPEERVRAVKRQRLVRAARQYLSQHVGKPLVYRFDVVAVVLTGGAPRIEHFIDAFES